MMERGERIIITKLEYGWAIEYVAHGNHVITAASNMENLWAILQDIMWKKDVMSS